MDGEKEIIESTKRNFFSKYSGKHEINYTLGKKVYNEGISSKKGYGIFKNFYFKLHEIISKITNTYEK